MNKILLPLFLFFIGSISAQTITYDIPIDSTIGLSLTSGDICTAPFTTEEAKQTSIGNSWGGTWTSINPGTAVSVEVQLMFSISDNPADYPTTLNGTANNMVNSGAAVNCATGSLLTWTLNPASYNSGGVNTFLVDYSGSSIINQVDNLPFANDPYLRVTITYAGLGLEDLSNTPAKLIRITDLTGREVKPETCPSQPLLYVYEDGTVKRVFRTAL